MPLLPLAAATTVNLVGNYAWSVDISSIIIPYLVKGKATNSLSVCECVCLFTDLLLFLFIFLEFGSSSSQCDLLCYVCHLRMRWNLNNAVDVHCCSC